MRNRTRWFALSLIGRCTPRRRGYAGVTARPGVPSEQQTDSQEFCMPELDRVQELYTACLEREFAARDNWRIMTLMTSLHFLEADCQQCPGLAPFEVMCPPWTLVRITCTAHTAQETVSCRCLQFAYCMQTTAGTAAICAITVLAYNLTSATQSSMGQRR